MLQVLRHKHVAKIIFWALLILILPAFVLWGTGSMGSAKGKGPTFVGMVGNKKVSFGELAEHIVAIRCQVILAISSQPQVMETFLKNKPFLAKLAWDRIIFLNEAKRQKIRIKDAEVISYIRSSPVFARNGAFDERVYEQALRYAMGVAPRTFEEIVRQNLAIQKLNDRLSKDAKITDAEAFQDYEKAHEIFKLSYVFFDIKDFVESVTSSEESLKKYYAQNEDRFGGLPFDQIKEEIKLMIAVPEAEKIAARRGEEVRAQIVDFMAKDGLSFEAAAEKAGVKAEETPFFSRYNKLEKVGDTPIIAEEAAALKADEISRPTATKTGTIIFRVAERQRADEEKFKKDKENYVKAALKKRQDKILEGWLREKEKATTLNIDFADFDKYYR